MKNLELKIEEINKLIESVSGIMDSLNFGTFDTVFPLMVNGIKEMHRLRMEIIEEYGIEKLLKYEPDLFITAKLIEKKFDNIIGVFTREEKKLEKELLSYASKKKITNYLRY
jgi:hypothetical protein